MNENKICFIGAGNMASCIIGGLLKDGLPKERIIASDLLAKSLEQLRRRFGVQVEANNQHAVATADIIVLSVKPQALKAVCEDIAGVLSHRPLVISIAAGIGLGSLNTWLGGNLPLVRCMPNTPAQVLKGASGLIANENVSEIQKQAATKLFSAIGITEWLKTEELMHAVTALSGSGPAYIFLVIEAMEAAAVKLGIEPETARKLAAQTVVGAAEMVLGSELEPAQLKRNVMSPGGTTERAIQVFDKLALTNIFEQAISAAAERSKELSEQLRD